MPKKSALETMIAFVQAYLDGAISRLDFELDFNHEMIKLYPKMERENSQIADCFYFYLAEEGVDQAMALSDAAHKKLIRKQFKEFTAAMRDGMF